MERLAPSIALQRVSGFLDRPLAAGGLRTEQGPRPPHGRCPAVGLLAFPVSAVSNARERLRAPGRSPSARSVTASAYSSAIDPPRSPSAVLATGSSSTCRAPARSPRMARIRASSDAVQVTSARSFSSRHSTERLAQVLLRRLEPPGEPVDRAAVAERARELPSRTELAEGPDRRVGVLERLVEPHHPAQRRRSRSRWATAAVNGCPDASADRERLQRERSASSSLAPRRRHPGQPDERAHLGPRVRHVAPTRDTSSASWNIVRALVEPFAPVRHPSGHQQRARQHPGSPSRARRLERPLEQLRRRARRRRGSSA